MPVNQWISQAGKIMRLAKEDKLEEALSLCLFIQKEALAQLLTITFFDDSAFQISEHFAYPNTLWSQCVRI